LSGGDLTEAEWRVLKGLLPIEPANRGRGRRPERNRAIINGILWRIRCGIAWRDVPPKIRELEHDLSPVPPLERGRGLESGSVTLAEIMADSGHYSIDSTTLRAMSRRRAEKGGVSKSSWPLAGRVHQ